MADKNKSDFLDRNQRAIDYLRISITDRCQNRCVYCLPPEGVELFDHRKLMSFEEIQRLVAVFAGLGVTRVRLTGGEPLVRRGIVDLVKMINSIEEISDISLTTNGLLLEELAGQLKDAGLSRVNVSLDVLNEKLYRDATRGADLSQTLLGLAAAKSSGLTPIKLNSVVSRSINFPRLAEIIDFGFENDFIPRFIELMPPGQQQDDWRKEFVPAAEILSSLKRQIVPLKSGAAKGGGPARYYTDQHGRRFGVIASVSEPTCTGCNRVRLSSTGSLRTCLGHEDTTDLLTPLRDGAGDDEIGKLILGAVACKPDGHNFGKTTCAPEGLSRIGG